jgi:hypothetical protein
MTMPTQHTPPFAKGSAYNTYRRRVTYIDKKRAP